MRKKKSLFFLLFFGAKQLTHNLRVSNGQRFFSSFPFSNLNTNWGRKRKGRKKRFQEPKY